MEKYNTGLPLELIQLVLSHLSSRHLMDAAQVCHSWSTIAKKVLHQDVYIHSNRQYTHWLKTLKVATLSQRRLVRTIVIHPQVHLDLTALPLYDLCPWVESFKIGAPSKEEWEINDMIGKRKAIKPVHWNYLRYLSGYHSHTSTLKHQSHHLKGVMCSFDDFITIAPSWPFLVDLHLTFGFMEMDVGLLETLATPILQTLKLNVHSLTGSSKVTPIPSLTSLSLYDLTTLDPGCYDTLLCKFPNVASLYLGFAFNEFYIHNTDTIDDIRLVDLVSQFSYLTRLTVHFQGANDYVIHIWPQQTIIDWMQTRQCRLRSLEIVYQRQTKPGNENVLGLDALTRTRVAQTQLETLTLNVYTLPVLDFLGGLKMLCLKSCPGFDLDLAQLIKAAPKLKVLDLTFVTLVGCAHGLQQLWLNSSKVIGNVVDTKLTVIWMKDVALVGSSRVWDLSDCRLAQVSLKQVTLGTQRIQTLKIHETTSDRNTWYSGSLSSDYISLELNCSYVEDVYFS